MSFLTRKSVRLLQFNSPENFRTTTSFIKKLSQDCLSSTQLIYSEYGEPEEVIKVCTQIIDKTELKSNELLIKMLASPINPADINTIQGKYPVKPPLPAVAGNEGVGEVISMGLDVRDFSIGDHVILLISNYGTWRNYAILTEDSIFKIPKSLGLVEAATLAVNPCTAYRMLKDFVDLKPGDSVLQNGANSTVGQYVIQICKAWNIPTVNVIRNRTDVRELKFFLLSLGATHVLTEEELKVTDLYKSKQIESPRLALNCVGGKNALEVLRHLQYGGCMVTYGGMSKQPVTIPTPALIFKNIKVRGYWSTQWNKDNFNSSKRFKMIEDVISLMIKKDIKGPFVEMVNFNNYLKALSSTSFSQGMIGKKYILDLCNP